MRILIFHGYLLRGTGSNIYNANLSRALAKLGHEVHLLCQDRTADAPEGVTIYVPDIGEFFRCTLRITTTASTRCPFPNSTRPRSTIT